MRWTTSAPTSSKRFRQALSSPARAKILSFLARCEATASEVAAELGTTNRAARYHLQALQEAGLVEAISKPDAEGGPPTTYRTSVPALVWSDAEWGKLLSDQCTAPTRTVLAEIFRDSAHALQAGTIRGDRHLSHLPLRLDEEGWRPIAGLHAATLHSILDIQAEANERLRFGGDSFPALSVQMFLEMPLG